MRNVKRIDKILVLIQKIWKKYPDLRLFQLLINYFGDDDNLYYVEDDELEKRLKDFYKIS